MARRRFTRKRIEGILRDVADAITYGAAVGDKESGDVRALVSILTALRGPDGHADDRWKAVTTAMIRGAIASHFFGRRVPTDYYNHSGLDIERFDSDSFSTEGLRSGHFRSHIEDARDALLRFGIIEIAEPVDENE